MALFRWTTFDVRSLMPTGWDDQLAARPFDLLGAKK